MYFTSEYLGFSMFVYLESQLLDQTKMLKKEFGLHFIAEMVRALRQRDLSKDTASDRSSL